MKTRGAPAPMKVELAYGRDGLTVDLPATARPTVVTTREATPLADPVAAVRGALEHPVGSMPLADLAAGRSSACIVVCDITRPVPNGLFLRPMIETMLAAGIPLGGITVLVANGLHRSGDAAELGEVVGDPWVSEHVRVLNHEARNPAALTDLGTTSTRGTPIVINSAVVDADLRILTGLVEPHFMAGWSGGRKVLAPGVAGEQTIRTFHSARFMEHPDAVQGVLDGNPLHEEQLQILAAVGETYAFNTVIDDRRRLTFCSFGDAVESHLAAVGRAREHSFVDVPRRYSTVLTSAAGYPLDKTYYQTVKGMVTPLAALADGGTVIIVSECSEGFGSGEFRAAQRRLVRDGMDGFLDSIMVKQLADIDEWQTEMQLKPMRRARVQLYCPGMPASDRADTGVEVVDSLDEAVASALARSGEDELLVVPEGPYVIPVVSG